MPATYFTPGGKFWRELHYQFTTPLREDERNGLFKEQIGRGGIDTYQAIRTLFENPEMRRMIMDARQAEVFIEQVERPPIGDHLRLPFDMLYLEFTEPVMPTESQHGYEEMLIALVMVDIGQKLDAVVPDRPGAIESISMIQVTAFYRTADGESYADRSFNLDCSEGFGITSFETSLDPGFGEREISVFREPPDGEYFIARPGGEGRGYWERTVDDLARFAAWCIAFMTARGVVIVDLPLTRQQRRALGRGKHRPAPWHIVTVEPVRVTRGPENEGGGGTHSYRYDVRGHLRLGRHRLGDGSYREAVEWVRPHQRGLANSLYVPQTHTFENKNPEDGVLG